MCTILHNALADRHIYIYIYIYTNIAESRIERDYWPRFARYAHAARQLYRRAGNFTRFKFRVFCNSRKFIRESLFANRNDRYTAIVAAKQ